MKCFLIVSLSAGWPHDTASPTFFGSGPLPLTSKSPSPMGVVYSEVSGPNQKSVLSGMLGMDFTSDMGKMLL